MITLIENMGKEKHDGYEKKISRRRLIKGGIVGFAGLTASALGAPAYC